MKTKAEIFAKIAAKHLFVETLERRHSDRLDFHEVPVWAIEAALAAAYEAGKAEAALAQATERHETACESHAAAQITDAEMDVENELWFSAYNLASEAAK
jgi:hypothetical protein